MDVKGLITTFRLDLRPVNQEENLVGTGNKNNQLVSKNYINEVKITLKDLCKKNISLQQMLSEE